MPGTLESITCIKMKWTQKYASSNLLVISGTAQNPRSIRCHCCRLAYSRLQSSAHASREVSLWRLMTTRRTMNRLRMHVDTLKDQIWRSCSAAIMLVRSVSPGRRSCVPGSFLALPRRRPWTSCRPHLHRNSVVMISADYGLQLVIGVSIPHHPACTPCAYLTNAWPFRSGLVTLVSPALFFYYS